MAREIWSGRRILRHIAERSCLEGAGDVNQIIMHTEDKDAGRSVFDPKIRRIISSPPLPGRLRSMMTRSGRSSLKRAKGFIRRRRFGDFCVRLDGDEAPETGMNNRVVVDDKNLHASPATERAEADTSSCLPLEREGLP